MASAPHSAAAGSAGSHSAPLAGNSHIADQESLPTRKTFNKASVEGHGHAAFAGMGSCGRSSSHAPATNISSSLASVASVPHRGRSDHRSRPHRDDAGRRCLNRADREHSARDLNPIRSARLPPASRRLSSAGGDLRQVGRNARLSPTSCVFSSCRKAVKKASLPDSSMGRTCLTGHRSPKSRSSWPTRRRKTSMSGRRCSLRGSPKTTEEEKEKDVFTRDAEDKLQRTLRTKVEIDRRRRGGVIHIRYGSEDELIRVVDELMGRRR